MIAKRRRTDFAGTEVDCTVAGLPTVIKFDWEHMPAEPEAGHMHDSWTIGDTWIRLTLVIYVALRLRMHDGCVRVRVNGKSASIGCDLDDLEFYRGYWRVRSSDLEDALAMHMQDLDRAQFEEQVSARASLREAMR